MTGRSEKIPERLIYSWDDDEGGHMVCSGCPRTFGNAAACRSEPDAVREICEYGANEEE
jgi:hypothetical protein